MHELGIAHSVLEAVRAEARLHPGARLTKVGVRVGELSGVEPDSLSFCFEALVAGSDLAPLELAIERCPRRHRCPACDFSFVVVEYELACPRCGKAQTDCIGGEELELSFLEVEQP
jgi:hydrogenase nickel incorporation protein HypA/HybF